MDGLNLDASRRVLIFHLTTMVNTDMQFADASMTHQFSQGTLPYLARTGTEPAA